MIDPSLVLANVCDIRQYVTPRPSYLIDTNVLHYTRYDRYTQERCLTGGVTDACIEAYATHESVARANGSRLTVSRSVVFEFLRTIECAELQILGAILDPKIAQGDVGSFQIKKVRDMSPAGFSEAQKRISAYLSIIAKQFALVDHLNELRSIADTLLKLWPGRLVDSGDALLAAEAQASGITNILSNDADLAKMPGICLFTANSAAIAAAKTAKKLITF